MRSLYLICLSSLWGALYADGHSTFETDADEVAYAFVDSLLTQAANLRQARSTNGQSPDSKTPEPKPAAAEPKTKVTKTRSRKG